MYLMFQNDNTNLSKPCSCSGLGDGTFENRPSEIVWSFLEFHIVEITQFIAITFMQKFKV